MIYNENNNHVKTLHGLRQQVHLLFKHAYKVFTLQTAFIKQLYKRRKRREATRSTIQSRTS
jgi:hypothetical protein